jgi:DNA-binding response OmpR family regulator
MDPESSFQEHLAVLEGAFQELQDVRSEIEERLRQGQREVLTLERIAELDALHRKCHRILWRIEQLEDDFLGGLIRGLLPQSNDVPSTYLDESLRRLVGPEGTLTIAGYGWGVLTHLFRNLDRAVTFEELAQEVWKLPVDLLGRHQIHDVISRLRKRLRDVGANYEIHSISNHGYHLRPKGWQEE